MGAITHTFYRPEIEAVAALHRLDPDLVEAVVLTESSGDPHARRLEPMFWRRYMLGKAQWEGEHWMRWSASFGLMQVMAPTAIDYGYPMHQGPEDLFKPLVNLEYGCRVLSANMDWAEDDERKALGAYNGGRGNWQGHLPQQYATKVLATRDSLRALKSA